MDTINERKYNVLILLLKAAFIAAMVFSFSKSNV